MFGIFKKQRSANKHWLVYALMSYIVMLVVNGLAGSTTLIGGTDTAAVSDAYPNLFAPAGYTFAIWGVIYLLLGLYLARMFGAWRPKKQRLVIETQDQLLRLFTVSSVLNILWLFAWQYRIFWLSVVIMLGLLVSLIQINRLLGRAKLPLREYLLIRVPFSVYFGWISVATIANITTWLVAINWSGWGMSDVAWMVVMISIGALICAVTSLRQRNMFYALAFAWAYIGILIRHRSEDGFAGEYPLVITVTSALLAVIVAMTALGLASASRATMYLSR